MWHLPAADLLDSPVQQATTLLTEQHLAREQPMEGGCSPERISDGVHMLAQPPEEVRAIAVRQKCEAPVLQGSGRPTQPHVHTNWALLMHVYKVQYTP